jgi:hypothetical protein
MAAPRSRASRILSADAREAGVDLLEVEGEREIE